MQSLEELYRLARVPFLALAIVVSGCAQTATYNSSYIGTPNTPQADKLPGKVLPLSAEP